MTHIRKIPILLHMGMAAMGLAADPITRGETLSDDFWHDSAEGQSITASMEKTLRGIQKYVAYERAKRIEPEIIWQQGESKLRVYRNKFAKARVLIIPSLINSYHIVDIHPDRSFAKFLAQNFEVLILDWGDLKQDPDLQSFERILQNRMGDVFDFLKTDNRPLAGLGYCMGGILAAAADILYPEAFKTVGFIATPWDFSQNISGNFAEHLLKWAETGIEKMQVIDYVPADWLQMIFAGVDPAQIARKFSAFDDMDEQDIQTQIFIAVEDWVNGGADIPSPLLLESVTKWYQHNQIYKGQWTINGQIIDAGSIQKPSIIIVPSRDRIVPPAQAHALSEQLPHHKLLTSSGGHISLMISKNAISEIWQPLSHFLNDAMR